MIAISIVEESWTKFRSSLVIRGINSHALSLYVQFHRKTTVLHIHSELHTVVVAVVFTAIH